MSRLHPSERIARKLTTQISTADLANTITITVPDDQYGVLYRMMVSLAVSSQADLEALNPRIVVLIQFGGVTKWQFEVQPFIAHDDATTFFRHVNLGPWMYDFGSDGLYNGVMGEDLLVQVAAAGTGLQTRLNLQYSGD